MCTERKATGYYVLAWFMFATMSTWFVYLYKQTVSITVVVIGTKQFNDKTTHRQQFKTGLVQKWEMGKQKSRTFTGLFQDFTIFQGLNFFPILYNTTF